MTDANKTKQHRWKKGETGNPEGRPKGAVSTDRSIAIKLIFKVFQEEKNQQAFREAIQKEFNESPVSYYETYIKPLQPTIDQLHITEQANSGSANTDNFNFGENK